MKDVYYNSLILYHEDKVKIQSFHEYDYVKVKATNINEIKFIKVDILEKTIEIFFMKHHIICNN